MGLNYDLGGYMMRRCGGFWKYCNGRCEACDAPNFSTNTKVDPSQRYIISDKSIPNGTPSYLIRRSEDI